MRIAEVARPETKVEPEERIEPVFEPQPIEEPRLVEISTVERVAAPEEPQPSELDEAFIGQVFVWERLAWSVERTDEPRAEVRKDEPEPPSVADAETASGPEGGVEEARLIEAPTPSYPRVSLRKGEQGTVLCRIHVAADGSVERLEIVESSGFARLDEAALAALRRWRFTLRRVDGAAVAHELLHAVTFRLEKKDR